MPFDFGTILQTILTAKSLWDQLNINSYTYGISQNCFCLECGIAPKFIEVDNNTIIGASFDINDYGCNSNDIDNTLLDYHTIDYYFIRAIGFAETGINGTCDNPFDIFCNALGVMSMPMRLENIMTMTTFSLTIFVI